MTMVDHMNGEEFPDFDTWWASLDDYFQKIYDNINFLYETKKNSTHFLTRKEYMFIIKYLLKNKKFLLKIHSLSIY